MTYLPEGVRPEDKYGVPANMPGNAMVAMCPCSCTFCLINFHFDKNVVSLSKLMQNVNAGQGHCHCANEASCLSQII